MNNSYTAFMQFGGENRKGGLFMQLISGLVVLIIGAILILMIHMIITGRINAYYGGSDQTAAEIHKSYAHKLGWASLALVLTIETGVRYKGGSEHDAMFWAHAFFAAAYSLTLLGLIFVWTGHSFRYHSWLAYANIVFFLGLASLGIPMMYRRF